jgi:hypothetical protein
MEQEIKPQNISEKKPPYTVGEEFVDWADKYWSLHDKYHKEVTPNNPIAESCPYDYIRDTFIKKINDIVQCRINKTEK